MSDTFRLGRIVGVRVGVNWTVLVVFALVAYALAAERLPETYKGLHPLVYALGGLLTALGFLICLLAHELAHAIVARRNGVTVGSITLWLFGGVSRFDGEPATPGAELRIAGSGPLLSLLVGLLLGATSAGLTLVGVNGVVTGCVGWLALINVLLAAFNSVPAAPLDGGRLVHALLWRVSGDHAKATILTALAGRSLGWVALITGLLVGMRSADGLWLTVFGWFLIITAGFEANQARTRARLDGVPVRRIMTPDPFTVPATMTVAEFRRVMLPRHRHAAYPVVEDGRVHGVVIAERIRAQTGDIRLGALVQDAGRITPETPLTGVLARLARERLLVCDGDRLVGIVTPYDLTRELERLRHEGLRLRAR